MENYYLAIDIGASSGRHILGHVQDGRIVLEEMYRFENKQIRRGGHDCWDLEHLWNGILAGMKKCAQERKIPYSIGIDTWAVDYVLLDKDGKLAADAVAYRDKRTDGMDDIVERKITARDLYARTGIQKQSFNTIYQLMALKGEYPQQLDSAKSLLMIPDYLNYLLTGVKMQEYTNATSTGMVNAYTNQWDHELIRMLGFPEKLFGDLSMPGTTVGELLPKIQEEVGFQSKVVLPATHDTGSAFLAVPAQDDTAIYLSSGTWSLIGVENKMPVTTEDSRIQNFTNEGGAWHRYRYLKNIMGLWMIQSVRRELNGEVYVAGRESRHTSGRQWGFAELSCEAAGAQAFTSVVDVNDQCFLDPESMIDAIKEYCRNSGQEVPETVGQIMQCIYLSLAKSYQEAVQSLSGLTGKKYTCIHIVGGGCQDQYLNEMTARASGLPVYAGPVEGTAIGNQVVQMIAAGEFSSLAEAREAIRKSFDIKEVQ